MKTKPIEDIIIPDTRQRKDFNVDTLFELSESIRIHGLLHAPSLRTNKDPTLVAGERRIRAMKMLIAKGLRFKYDGSTVVEGHIPYILVGNREDIGYEELELIENVQRDDLTWQEKTAAVSRLHNLRLAQDPTHTQQDTAIEVLGPDTSRGSGTSLVRDAQIIQRHMDNPAVAKAKSKKEALKIIKKETNQELYRDLFKVSQTNSGTESGASSSVPHTLHRGDACKLLLEEEDSSIDVLITDPPYGIDADSFGDQASGEHEYVDTPEYFRSLMEVLAVESYRICKARAHGYVFCDIRHWEFLAATFGSAGWHVWHRPFIWFKNGGMVPRPEHGPRNSYETIMFLNKGDRKVLAVENDCIVSVPRVSTPRHAAEKPVGIYRNLLQRSARPGDRILDPFAGSGVVFPAANSLDLTAVGYNLSEDDYIMAHGRLGETYES